ncbi:MAG TPA: tetratricopeptide repeat protein [Candidatus Obscuribacterales bacterium]
MHTETEEKSQNHIACSPESSIAVLVTMAQDAERQNNLAQAEALLKRACKQAESHLGNGSVAVASLLWHLSVVYERAGRLDLADSTALRVSEILLSTKGCRRPS